MEQSAKTHRSKANMLDELTRSLLLRNDQHVTIIASAEPFKEMANRSIQFSFSSRRNNLRVKFGKITPFGGIAQLVERLLCKQNVIGSNPVTSTILL